MAMFEIPGKAIAAAGLLATCTGCATPTTFAPSGSLAPENFVQHAADSLMDGVAYTRASTREVAGWCWNDKATDNLAYVARARVGESQGVGVTVPAERGTDRYVSCSWHTHPWGPHVAPGPSRQDLRNSMLPWVKDIVHFVLDEHGIWQYANGRVIEICPWDSPGTSFDMAACHAGSHQPTNTYTRVERFYGRRP
jgi:hypothetical protein